MDKQQLAQALAELKGIHTPDPIGIWPLAIGWWILLCIIVLSLIGIFLFYRNRKKTAYKRLALNELEQIKLNYQKQQNSQAAASQLSQLLRRVLISKNGRGNAGLIQQQWLEQLDQLFNTNDYTNGIGQQLIEIPYQNKNKIQLLPLFDLIHDSIRSLK